MSARWLPLCALALPGVAVAGQRVYVHTPNVAASVMDADRDACVTETLALMNGPSSPAPPLRNPTPGQAVAHAFDLRGPKLAAAHEQRCMADRGYAALTLTGPETKALGKARDAAGRDRWYDAFVASDLSARIAAAGQAPTAQ